MMRDFIRDNIRRLCKEKGFNELLPQSVRDEVALYPGKSLSEKLYTYYHQQKELPICKCGNITEFISFREGYKTSCCRSCARTGVKQTEQQKAKRKASVKRTMNEKYNVDNAFQLQSVKDTIAEFRDDSFYASRKLKTIETNNQIYGCDWANQSITVKEKRAASNLRDYGTTCTLHSSLVFVDKDKQQKANRISNQLYRDRITAFCYTENLDLIASPDFKKGDTVILHCKACGQSFPWVLNKEPVCRVCNPIQPSFRSKQEQELVLFLQTFYKGRIVLNDRAILAGKELDIYLPEINLAIEYNGCYWHAVNLTDHEKKTRICAEKGIKLIHIFSSQWQVRKELILSNIKALIETGYYEDYSFLLQEGKLDNAWPLDLYLQEKEVIVIEPGGFVPLNAFCGTNYPYYERLYIQELGKTVFK